MQIHAVPAFSDNYIWAIVDQGKAVLVDPGCTETARAFLDRHNLTLEAILITHWHADHTGGIAGLTPSCHGDIIGPLNPVISGLTRAVAENDALTLLGQDFSVLDLKGHTLDHIGFYSASMGAVFVGDTLFSSGCGRMFEGTPAQFFHSLQTLSALPDDTVFYCAHEYTLSNLAFAKAVEPDNTAIIRKETDAIEKRKANLPTLPNTLGNEKATNPFLRTLEPAVIQAACAHGATSEQAVDVFAALRLWKDTF